MDRPLRFCMITTFYPPENFGGDGYHVHHLSNELAGRGHKVDVIHCTDAFRLLAHRRSFPHVAHHPNVTVHKLRSPLGFLSPLATHQTGYPLLKGGKIRSILDKRFDVIHYHNISLVGGPKVLEMGSGIKLYSVHEYWLLCPTHVLFKCNRAPCRQRRCFACSLICRRPPQMWRYSGLLASALKHVDAFLSPSGFGRNIHQQMGLNLPMRHLPYFLPSGSTSLEDPEPARESTAPYFLFVGRLEKIKGLHTIIPIFRHPGRAPLWVAGRGNFERRLVRMAEGSPNIRFLGYQSGPQLQSLVRNAVAVIVPSVCYDLFPLVILEAYRERTPVIVRNIGGMPEMIRESGGGFLFNAEQELIAAMDRLLADRVLRDDLGNRGFQAYRLNWTPDVYIRRYLELIHDLGKVGGREQPAREAARSPTIL